MLADSATAYPGSMQTTGGPTPRPGRLTVHLRYLSDGSYGYQVAERKRDGQVVREFAVDWSRDGNHMTVEYQALVCAFAHNAKHYSRVGRFVTAFGNRDWDLKLHYVVGDNGSDKVRVACGKDVTAAGDEGKTIAEARAAGLLDTWGDYRCCRKCWRNPALKLAIAKEIHGA